MLRERAARRPGAVVIESDGDRLTLARLRERALRTARALIALGVRPGDRVAIWAPNSAEWAVTAFGAWDAGAVVAPVNARSKGAEAADLLARTGASVLFTTRDLDELLEPRPPGLRHVVILDGDRPGALGPGRLAELAEDVDERLAEERAAAVGPGDLCEVMPTSGTTGAPRGVMLEHGQLLRAYWDWSGVVTLREGDRYPVTAPFSHGFGLNAGLLAGVMRAATTIPVAAFDPGTLHELIARRGVTVLAGPPALFHALLEEAESSGAPSTLRVAVCGASSVPAPLVHRLLDRLGAERVINAYGLMEGTVVSMTRADDPVEVVAGSAGRAMPGVEVRLSGDGEILVRGYGVMRGYWGEPGLTAEAVDEAGWLRTGDAGALDERGNLTVLDRKDDLFIVGGFNVSPAEVESLLLRHEDVAQAAVIGVPDPVAGEAGWAFVVPRVPGRLDPEELLAWARRTMTDYKVPRRVLVLDELPTNANGKVDKRSLRSVEYRICRVWADLLGTEDVDARQDFFRLGGHSLLAAEAAIKIGDELGVDLPLRTLVEEPTVAGLARRVRESAPGRTAAVVAQDGDGPAPLSGTQVMLWLTQLARQPPLGDHPGFFLAGQYEIEGRLDVDALRRAARHLLVRHEPLRSRVDLRLEGGGYQYVQEPYGDPLHHYDLRGRAGELRAAVARFDEVRLEPQSGRLLAAGLFTLADDHHILIVKAHHIATDDRSLGVLERELGVLYADFAAGRPPSLPPPGTRYGDFARWQERTFFAPDATWRDDPHYGRCLEYWSRRTEGLAPMLLPADGAGVPGEKRTARVTAGLPVRVEALARAAGCTPYTVLLACYQALLAAELDRRDIAVVSPLAGRDLPEIQRTVGLFTEITLMRTGIDLDRPFREVLGAVAATVREALLHQGVPTIALTMTLPGLNAHYTDSHYIGFEYLERTSEPYLGGLRVTRRDQMDEEFLGAQFMSQIEVMLVVRDDADGYRAALFYDPDLFGAGRMAGLLDRYRGLVERVVADPGTVLAGLAGQAGQDRARVG
nr:AMP-binding protein [Bailinhaonella thermotolerans]